MKNKKTRKIIFIGGGDILSEKQDEIFLKLFSDFGSKPIKLLYLPFALFGDDKKVNTMSDYMSLLEDYLCKLNDNLHFDWISRGESHAKAVNKFKIADMVFLSGGDTEFLIDYLKRTGLIKEIAKFYESGGIVIGNSAGCLALAGEGASLYKGEFKDYHGFGIIKNFIPIVHYNTKNKSEVNKFVRNLGDKSPVYLEENKACLIIDESKLINLPN